MKYKQVVAVALLAAASGVAGCDTGDGGEATFSGAVECLPGAQLQCACAAGGTGISLCPTSGFLTGPCEGCADVAAGSDGNPATEAVPSIVSVDFRLFDGDKFPTYVAHLYGYEFGSETLNFVEVEVHNSASSSAALTIEAELQGYSFTAVESVTVQPGQTDTFLIDVTFDFDALYSISAPVAATATVRLYESGGVAQPLGTETQTITVVPKNTVFWATKDDTGQLVGIHGFVATLVTPHDAAGEVDKLLTDAAYQSAFGVMYGYSLFSPAKVLNWTVDVGPGTCWQWPAYYKGGQAVGIGIDVTCFPCLDYNASYVLQNDLGADVLRVENLGEWSGSAQVPADGWYVHSACNPASNSSNRTFTVSRSVGANDVAEDQLIAIYSALKTRGTVYTNVPASYFDSTQNVKTPSESLASGSQNCIDGSLVFASALEAIGMRAGIAIVPGHAFAAVRMWDAPDANWLPIETTKVSTDTAATALADAFSTWEAALANGTLTVLDIQQLREAGILPAPM